MELQLILAIAELIIKHGIPAGLQIISTWSKDKNEITIKDIEDLRLKIKEGKTYFE